MKPTQMELMDWAITQIQIKYKDNIALLIGIGGHAMEDDCHGECFDYFIRVNDNRKDLLCLYNTFRPFLCIRHSIFLVT